MTSPGRVGPCPACGRVGQRAAARTWLDDGLVACPSCGIVTLAEPPADDELSRLYRSDLYAPGSPRGARLVTQLHRIIGRWRLRILPKPPGRLVDVGSGKGQFLDAARRAGWEVLGIEISDAAANEAARRYGLTTVVADWAAADAAGPFDAVTFWHVLEHLPDPVEALERARPLLAPDGVVVVSVPNLASWQARLFGMSWLHLDLPRHLNHFTPRTLRQVMERAGFEVDHLDTVAPEMEVLGVVQSIQNRLGMEPNLALRFVKRDTTAAGVGRGLGSLVLAAVSLPVAAAFALIAAPLGHGASIQMVARTRTVGERGSAPLPDRRAIQAQNVDPGPPTSL